MEFRFVAFNLSILECKYLQGCTIKSGQLPFNLSILECKCCEAQVDGKDYGTFNLSILECKYYFAPHTVRRS